MGVTVIDERRSEERIVMRASTRATVRPGCEVVVIDLSAGGALVQARRPLRPGARVHVQITARGRTIALTARILRCVVWSLNAADGVLYRGALQFERRCACFSEQGTGSDHWLAQDDSGEAEQERLALPREL